MLESIGKYVGGKVITLIVLLGCGLTGFWFYKHPDQLEALWLVVRRSLVWFGFVAILPWATFFVVKWVVSRESNLAAGLMLGGYLAADVAFALYLAGGLGHGALSWSVLIVGFLAAAVYNFLVCDFQADRMEAF